MTTDLLLGGGIALFVLRQLRATFLAHLHADRPATGRELARLAAGGVSAVSGSALGAVAGAVVGDGTGAAPPRGWGAGARWVVSVLVRLAFFGWLYEVTDGAAFLPFGFAQNVLGGTVWQPLLVALGLSEVAARLAALAVRALGGRRRGTDLTPPTVSLAKNAPAGELSSTRCR